MWMPTVDCDRGLRYTAAGFSSWHDLYLYPKPGNTHSSKTGIFSRAMKPPPA